MEELHKCACKVLIGWSEIHHGNSVRELSVSEMEVFDPRWIYGSSVVPGLLKLLCCLYLHAENFSKSTHGAVIL